MTSFLKNLISAGGRFIGLTVFIGDMLRLFVLCFLQSISSLCSSPSIAQKLDGRSLQFKPGIQIYATGLSLLEINKRFETEGLEPLEDVVSSFNFTGELILEPLKAGIGFSYGGGGSSNSARGSHYSNVRISSFAVGLISYLDFTRSISLRSGLQYFSLSTHIDQFRDLAIPGFNRFVGASFVTDAQAIEPALACIHKPGRSKRFFYGLFASYYYIVSQSGWIYKQNGQRADLPNLSNDNNLRVGILCAYSFPD